MVLTEQIQKLIDYPVKPNPSEWAMDCEDVLSGLEDKDFFNQSLEHIDNIKKHNGAFQQHIDILVAILKRALKSLDNLNAASKNEPVIDDAVENVIEADYREFFERFKINDEFENLYTFIDNIKLRSILATSHHELNNLFHLMNQRLSTHYYPAEDSRDLIYVIDLILELYENLKDSKYSFDIDEYYKQLFDDCQSFLREFRGSDIPANHPKISLQYVKPIFTLQNTIEIRNAGSNFTPELKLIGQGSYAQVYKYKDPFYKKVFVLKRAFKNLDNKDLERFKKEYEIMNQLSSPYIVEVYSYNEDNNEYIMEYMDETLEKYISENNTKLDWNKRKSIAAQVVKGFAYAQGKSVLHRDISTNNILVKKYDDGTVVVKISDFGLGKTPDSTLTSYDTDIKGRFNDPALRIDGFKNYNLYHESYSLTLIVYFIMTGRVNFENEKNESLKNFLLKGIDPVKEHRYKNAEEMLAEVQQLYVE